MTLHKLFQAHLKRADVMFHKSYKGETRKQKVTSAQGGRSTCCVFANYSWNGCYICAVIGWNTDIFFCVGSIKEVVLEICRCWPKFKKNDITIYYKTTKNTNITHPHCFRKTRMLYCNFKWHNISHLPTRLRCNLHDRKTIEVVK